MYPLDKTLESKRGSCSSEAHRECFCGLLGELGAQAWKSAWVGSNLSSSICHLGDV